MFFRKNKMAIGKRVFETGKHIDTLSVHDMNEESKYHLAYMALILKLDKEECYRRWLELDDRIVTPLTRDEFETAYRCALETEYDKDAGSFKIYQSDIDYINGLDLSIDAKEIGLVLIAYCRSISKWEYKVSRHTVFGVMDGLNHTLTANFRTGYAQKAEELKRVGLIQVVPGKKYWNKFEGVFEYGSDTNRVTDPKHRGIDILESDMVFDVTELFWMFRVRVCPKCGKEFVIGNKTKTDLCEECFAKHDKEQYNRWALESMRRLRGSKINEIRICEDCGKEFECSGNCKRTKCDECYKRYSKERHRKNALKSYHNKT